jgi:hypothetical protein
MTRRNRPLTFTDANEFNKKLRALKKYQMRSYKYIIFKLDYEKDFSMVKGRHELEIPTDPIFKKIYGQVKIIYYVFEEGLIIEDLVPGDILKACYMKELPSYKGVPFRDEKDIFKIKLVEKMSVN